MVRAELLAALAVAMVATWGCGSRVRRVHVFGDVSLDGKPVQDGSISLAPIEGTNGPTTGGAIRHGHYDVPVAGGPLAGGSYQVQIDARGPGRSGPNPANPKGPPLLFYDNIAPARYNTQSVLKITLGADADEKRQDYDLKSRI